MENKINQIPMYKSDILKLLRGLWKVQDFKMWQQIYTIHHHFARDRGVLNDKD